MPRADDLVADDVAFAERTAAMRAGVLAREEAFARVIERDAPLADRADACAADRKIIHLRNLDEIRHCSPLAARLMPATPAAECRRVQSKRCRRPTRRESPYHTTRICRPRVCRM